MSNALNSFQHLDWRKSLFRFPSKVARNPPGIDEPQQGAFQPYGWAAAHGNSKPLNERYLRQLHLMMLGIADALPLILEGSGRRTELQIPVMLALLFFRRGL